MEKFKLAVLISGSGTNLQALINKFDSDERIEICCVISNNEAYYTADFYSLIRIKFID